MINRLRCLGLFLALMSIGTSGVAQEKTWGLSPYIGVHDPNLRELNSGLFQAPYTGTADNIDVFGETNRTTFFYHNPLTELDPGVTGGLEFRWRFSDRHEMLIGLGTWGSTSYATAAGPFPVQGAFESALSYRKGTFSYNEFYFGYRYNALRKPKKYNLYLSLGAHEVFDINYREDFSLLFLSGPPKSFRRSVVVLSKATGLLLLQGSGGGEWFLRDWLTLGVEAGYTIGTKDILLGNGRISTDFLDTDNLSLQVPIVPDARGNMTYRDQSGNLHPLRLSFDGWKALLKVTIYY